MTLVEEMEIGLFSHVDDDLLPRLAATRPSRSAVIRAIEMESGCTCREARLLLRWLTVTRYTTSWMFPGSPRYTRHLGGRAIKNFHTVLAQVMPSGQVAIPGSAHALIESRLYFGRDAQITHTSSTVRMVKRCSVRVDFTKPKRV